MTERINKDIRWICLNCGHKHTIFDSYSERDGDKCTIWCVECGSEHTYIINDKVK